MKTIVLSGHVGTDITAARVRQELATAKGSPVEIEIASPGGFLDEAIEIYNLLRGHARGVTARLVGLVASAATLIACAARRIVALPSSLWMIHSSSLSISGNASDLEHGAEILRKYDELLASAYAAKTGKSREEIRAWMEHETWMTVEEALGAGFVDAIEGSATQGRADLAAAKAQVRALAAKGHTSRELERAAALLDQPSPTLAPEAAARLGRLGYTLADVAADPETLAWLALGVSRAARELYARSGVTLEDLRGDSWTARFLRNQIRR
jgi:ATP-dependent protease ClpP protease subunit